MVDRPKQNRQRYQLQKQIQATRIDRPKIQATRRDRQAKAKQTKIDKRTDTKQTKR